MKAGWHIDAAKMRGSPSHHSTGRQPATRLAAC
jgi:hypothetical protein